MKLETELKPGDIVLLKVLACILILFLHFAFLYFRGWRRTRIAERERTGRADEAGDAGYNQTKKEYC